MSGARPGPRARQVLERTTPSAGEELLAMVPELAAFAKPALRLHPRSGEVPLIGGSKLGGTFLWPEETAFPEASDCGTWVPWLQVDQRLLPTPRHTSGWDTFQLWASARRNPLTGQPRVLTRWWSSAQVARRRTDWPEPGAQGEDPGCVPLPCLLIPEPIVEYPHFAPESTPPGLAEAFAGSKQFARRYRASLSACPASKLGGWPFGLPTEQVPRCGCGQPMELLAQLADWEGGAVDLDPFSRWIPEEDAWVRLASDPNRVVRTLNAADLAFAGRRLLVFVCWTCPDWPVICVWA